MDAKEWQTIPLVKKSVSYKIIIPAEVERLIRFLCERVWSTEWSGVLFYTVTGNFEDGSLEVHCVDIFPMDIGTVSYTEFDMSPDVISYMAENPSLLDCKMGLIHSHNNMSTFFSGTDITTLKEEGCDRNHFVSLIVNNAGKYTAAITRKIKYNAIRTKQYESFDGTVDLEDREVVEGEELEYFNLDIVFEEESDNKINDVANRLKEIKNKKPTLTTPNTSVGISYPEWKKTHPDNPIVPTTTNIYTPSLFSDEDDFEPKYTPHTPYKYTTPSTSVLKDKISAKDVDEIVNQLVTGSVTVTKLNDKDARDLIMKTVDARFDTRFGKDDPSLTAFEYWATDFVDFLLWFSGDSGSIVDDDTVSPLAEKVIKALEKLPKSKYIDKYIDIISSYATRAF